MPCGPSSALISRTLPSLWEAATRWLPRGNLTPLSSSNECGLLQFDQFTNTLARQLQQREQFFLAEGGAFGGALNLDQAAGAGQDEIGVGLRGGIFLIIQVQHRHALDDAAADRRDMVLEYRHGDQAGLLHEGQALAERDKAAGDGGG